MRQQIPTIVRAEHNLARAFKMYLAKTSSENLKALKRAAWDVPRDTPFSLAVVAFIAVLDAVRKMSAERLRDE